MPERLSVAVIGCGRMGAFHVRNFLQIESARLLAVADPDAAARQRAVAGVGIRQYGDWRTMLEAEAGALDAVSIACRSEAHAEIALGALDAGLHVLVEKPIATTLPDADALLAIARRTGAMVQTGHVERFNRAVRAALPYVESPRFIESDRLAPFNARGSDVAVVLDLMIHDIDLVRTFVGGGVTSVAAVGVPVLTPFVDIANARLTFDGGAVANITASRVSRERMRKLRIFQQSGYLSLDLAAGMGEFYRLRQDLRDDVDRAMFVQRAHGAQALESFVERIVLEAPEGEPLRLELEAFVRAVSGDAPVTVSGDDGREALAVALTIVRDIERTMPSLAGTVARGRA